MKTFTTLALLACIAAACDLAGDRRTPAEDPAAAMSQTMSAASYHGVLFDPPIPRPDFVLTDATGRSWDFRSETEGRVALLFIGYTSCPDVCPLHMASIASALRQHPELADRVEVVFITADPERDTPERLRSWLGGFDPDFVGLRGTPEEVHAIEASMNLPPSVVPAGQGTEYEVGHAALVIAFTPDGEGRVGYPSGAVASDYAEDLPRLVAGEVPAPGGVGAEELEGEMGRGEAAHH